jgi:hypothetical protein
MQFNTLIYRHELIDCTGRMQTFAYHYTGHRKQMIDTTDWRITGRPAPPPRGGQRVVVAPPRPRPPIVPPKPVLQSRHIPAATTLGLSTDWKELFGRAVCINLDRRADRWERFLAELPSPWPFAPVDRFRAIDTERCPPPDWFVHDRGQWGCRQSHLRVIEDALNDGVESLLVFEDDAEFPADFLTRAREFLAHVPTDWEILFLGGTHTRGRTRRVNDHVIIPSYVTLAHAYAIRGAALRAVYDWGHRHTPQRAEFDHRLGAYSEMGTVGTYAPAGGWCVWQRSGYSDLTLRERPRRGVHPRENTQGVPVP